MIERAIEFSVKNRAIVLLLTGALALVGVYALSRTPIDAIPDLSENQVIVFADWMGRSPKEIEDQVTYPLSVNLQGLAGVKAVRATSEFNFSMINVIFEDSVDFYFARERVLERLSIAPTFLPQGVVPYLAPDATALGQIFWYTVEGKGYDLGELRAIQDWYLRYQLNAVPGVAQVASAGGFVREYQIDVDPDRLRAQNVTLGEVTSAVAKSNSAVGGDVIEKNRAEYLIRGTGWIRGREDIESIVVAERGGVPVYVRNVATVQIGPAPRRSVLVKDGQEVVGGVVLMRFGENPLDVTERVKKKIEALESGLPAGVRVVPFYERTRLIRDAIGTLRKTLLEEMAMTALVVYLVLSHLGSALVIVATLPLAILVAFILMYTLGISANIMSLSGIAISIGVLVDAGIVMTENAFTRLYEKFGERPVRGDTRETVLEALKVVGRPLFFSIMIMLISFLPVFALTGMEGKMFRPLAFTKTFALIGVALLGITLVPALIPTFVRGRLRSEQENWLVRSVVDVYRPVLLFLLEKPKWVATSFALLIGLGLYVWPKIGREFMPPLDEGALMDMPVTTPRASVTEAANDIIARDALLRQLPEIESAVAKAGRADTPTDPAPIDMVETVVNLAPRERWPRRALDFAVFERLSPSREAARKAAAKFDEAMRGIVLERLEEFQPELERALAEVKVEPPSPRIEALLRPWRALTETEPASAERQLADARAKKREALLRERVRALDWELEDRAPDVLASVTGKRPDGKPFLRKKTKRELVDELNTIVQVPGWSNIWTQPIINRVDMLASGVRTQVGVKVSGDVDIDTIQRAANEVAAVLREIEGAADVFADQVTGENYLEIEIDRERAARYGIAVGDVQETIEVALGGKRITTTVEGRRRFPVRVRYPREAREDEEKIGRILVSGMAGAPAAPPRNEGAPMAASVLAPVQVPLSEVATIRTIEGPSMIKSENGLLRAYVQLNVRGRDLIGFVEEAQRAIAERVRLPRGVFLEWSGEFEHELRARRTLSVIGPAVIFSIFLILYFTYSDMADAGLIMLALPGALVGGLLFQWLFGYNRSVAVFVGYIACLGLAAETGIVMLVYLREAIERRGGLAKISSLDELKQAVVEGAVHRLRPKLLTEGTAILGLVPMLWASGAGAEIMRPLAAPVLGGILIADEVIDVFIPVIFYAVRKARWLRLRTAPVRFPESN
jgi:Cu(I)/Ag(I) efflux system membrane protein CusA/SilA